MTPYIRALLRWADAREKHDQAVKPRWRLYWKYEVKTRLEACNAIWAKMTTEEREGFRETCKKAVGAMMTFSPDSLENARKPMIALRAVTGAKSA